MECQKARQRLNPFLEGDLEGAQAREMETHVACCSTCRAELEGLRGSLALLEGLPSLSPPPGLASRVMAQVLQKSAAPKPARSSAALGWILAAVLGTLGALLLYGYLGEGWPWDTAAMEALQPIALEDLPSLLVSVEAGLVIGVTLLFVAVASLFFQLMGREQQQCQHGRV